MQLFQNKPGTGVRKIHHKLMVIDERLVIAGSFNYIGPAGALNARTSSSSATSKKPIPLPKPRNDDSLPTRWPSSSASSPICANHSHGSRNRLNETDGRDASTRS